MIIEKYIKSVTGLRFGFVVIKPTGYSAANKYPAIFFLHGAGGVGTGDDTSLNRLINGEIPPNLQAAVDKYKFILLAPNTEAAWNQGEARFIIDWSKTNLPNIDTQRRILTGLSLGGGGTVNALANDPTICADISAAIPIAMQWTSGTWKNIVDAKVPMWFFHNLFDTNAGTPVAATNGTVDAINNLNPQIKAVKTLYNRSGHGGWGETYDPINPPVAPLGQGFTTATFTIYEWALGVTKSNPIQPDKFIPGQPVPDTTLIANAGADATTTQPYYFIDGRGSVGYKSAKWELVGYPQGVNPYYPIIVSGGWITSTLNLPKEGSYTIKLSVYPEVGYLGTPATDLVTITYSANGEIPVKQVLQKVYIPKNNNYVYVYDDGTTETKAN